MLYGRTKKIVVPEGTDVIAPAEVVIVLVDASRVN